VKEVSEDAAREVRAGSGAAREWGLAALVSACASLAILIPFWRLGTASGHDVSFHMASWLEAANQWKQGILFPRWAEHANFGFGEPRFIFYPPLSWLFGALLGSLVRWTAVAGAFIFCAQAFAGLSAYALLRRVSSSRLAALLGAAFYVANPYTLLIVYMRSDFAEQLAIAFFPLLLLAALGIADSGEPGDGSARRNVVFFAVTFCAVWLSNAPAAVIATYAMAVLFLAGALSERSPWPALRGAAAMALGFALAAFYMVPAAYEQRWVNISGALSPGLTPAENFLFAATSDAEHDTFNRVASWTAVLLISWTVAAIAAAWSKRESIAPRAHRRLRMAGTLFVVAALLMLPFTLLLWRFLPELRFVQFPWRWMSIVAVCTAIFLGAAMRGVLRWLWPVIAMVVLVAFGRYLVQRAWWDTEDMPALQAAMQSGSGFEGTDEYDPAGDDHTDLRQNQPAAQILRRGGNIAAAPASQIAIFDSNAENRVIRVRTPVPARVALRLVNYPAWRVTVNGAPATVEHPETSQQIIVAVPAGTSEIRAEFTRTPDRTLGGCISLAGLAVSVGLLAGKRRRAA